MRCARIVVILKKKFVLIGNSTIRCLGLEWFGIKIKINKFKFNNKDSLEIVQIVLLVQMIFFPKQML